MLSGLKLLPVILPAKAMRLETGGRIDDWPCLDYLVQVRSSLTSTMQESENQNSPNHDHFGSSLTECSSMNRATGVPATEPCLRGFSARFANDQGVNRARFM